MTIRLICYALLTFLFVETSSANAQYRSNNIQNVPEATYKQKKECSLAPPVEAKPIGFISTPDPRFVRASSNIFFTPGSYYKQGGHYIREFYSSGSPARQVCEWKTDDSEREVTRPIRSGSEGNSY